MQRALTLAVMDLSTVMVLALIVYAWRALRRTRGIWSGPIADVGDAPPDAEPIARPRLSDDGLATYYLHLPPADPAAPESRAKLDREPQRPKRKRGEPWSAARAD